MKHLKKIAAGLLIISFFLASCKKEIPRTASDPVQNSSDISVNSAGLLSKEVKSKLAGMRKALAKVNLQQHQPPAALQERLNAEFRDIALKALKATGAAKECDDYTPLYQWLDQQLSDWDDEVINDVLATGMLDIPFYYAYVFENKSAGQYFGPKGEYTFRSIKTFRDLKQFWDIPSSKIVLAAFHGNVLRDRYKLILTYMEVYGLTREDAELYADYVIYIVNNVPQYRKGNHPIFTFNAFASVSITTSYGDTPPKICMGDGIQQAFTAIGYDDVATQAIIAHEFGHQIQFALGIFNDAATPESTRRLELMADAFSSFFLSHSRGAFMQWKRTKEYFQVYYNIGDCATTDLAHHGTPDQRMAAAEWAYNLINRWWRRGNLMGSRQFVTLFDAALPEILSH
ncbi:MAG: hypothetical protein QM791_09820 [Ferruginibacter sp.]